MREPLLQIRDLPDTGTCWALLERVASSSYVKRAARLQELLFYLGKCSLKDRLDTVHEQQIGVEVFGRSGDYDTSDDNIVRTNVSELRKRVEAYFEGAGAHETLIVEIPRGSYVPIFKNRPVKPQIASETATAKAPEPAPANVVPISKPADAASVRPSTFLQSRWVTILAGVIIVALAASCAFYRYQYRTLYGSMYPWQSQPAVAELWSGILNARPDTDIVIADASFGLLRDLSKRSFPFNDYLSRSYVSQLQDQDLSPDMRTAVSRIVAWDIVNPDEVLLAQRIQALEPLGKNIHLYNARNYTPDLLKRDNVILIGGGESNPWVELFEDRMNFTAAFDGGPHIMNRAPAPGEQHIYYETDSVHYCVVAYLPNSEYNGVVMLMEGTGAEATEAGGDFLLSEDRLSNFKKTLHVKNLPYFEVLLRVSSVRGTPLAATIEAYRPYPNLH
jgi:hypothetical protein